MNAEQYMLAASQHFRAGNYDQALALLKQALINFPDHEVLLGLAASCYGEMKMLPEAKIHFEKVLQVNPRNLLARHQYGLVFFQELAYDAALEQWAPLIEQPTDFLTKYYAAVAHAALGRLDQAKNLAQQAKKAMPEGHALESPLSELINNLTSNVPNE